MLSALLIRESTHRGIPMVIESAGLKDKPSSPASDNAKQTMKELGLSIEDHQSRQVKDLPNLSQFTHVYCMEKDQIPVLVELGIDSERIHLANEAGGGVPNPYPKGMDIYRQCAHVLTGVAVRIAEDIS